MKNPYFTIVLAVLGILATIFLMNSLSPNPKQILGVSTFGIVLNLKTIQAKAEGGNQTFGTLLLKHSTPPPPLQKK